MNICAESLLSAIRPASLITQLLTFKDVVDIATKN